MSRSADQYDVIVIGGGPAGAAASGLLSKWGRRVLLLEREKFPRYHIGESLVPGVLPVLEELGALDLVEQSGAMRKYGVTLAWGEDPRPWTVHFNESSSYEHAYEVKRAEFDNLLLTHSRTLGTVALEEANVREPVFEDGRCVGVRYTLGRTEEITEVRAPFVIDCSGQSKLMARQTDAVAWHDDLKNLAVWTYFQGGDRLEGIDAGNILVESRPPGWLWLIPFSDGTCSVGFVAPMAEFAAAKEQPAELLRQRIAESGHVGAMLKEAVQVAGYRTAKDWSYHTTTMHGPGYISAGDAAAFIDPLFSTGVMLSMRGAAGAARTVHRILDTPAGEEERLRNAYEESYRSFLDVVVNFVRFFYDPSREVVEYFERAKNLIDPAEAFRSREDFVTLISGLYSSGGVMEPDLSDAAPAAS